MFRDECELEVFAGKGGDGASSFRREKYVPKGGPDGGNGGKGGDVILVATGEITSLLSVGRKPYYRAKNGGPGGPRNRSGANGEECMLQVPLGTEVRDAVRGHLLRDLVEEGDRVVVAAGGRGGRGNASFANSMRQSPRQAESGREGEVRELRLELKLFAEVGLIGLPNAGKSTLLSVVSAAEPKIADYPFTTLHPQVGICSVSHLETLVLADLPGLIEGAASGAGLGHRFLRHVERCRVLMHLVDCSASAADDPGEEIEVIARELREYSEDLASRPRLFVATKVEDEVSAERARALEKALGERVFPISSVQREGLDELLTAALKLVKEARAHGSLTRPT